jgi:hypothetical protein
MLDDRLEGRIISDDYKKKKKIAEEHTRIIPALNVSVISERKVPVQYLFLIQYLK